MNSVKFVCFFLAVSIIHTELLNIDAEAEFICSSDISYKWVKSVSSVSQTTAGAQPTPSDPSTVHVATVQRKGSDETAAKNALQVEVNRLKVSASEACARDHEGFGGCVSTKLAKQSSLLQSLDFSARREVEKALTDECRAQLGSCNAVSSSDPQCREKVDAAPTPVGVETGKKGDGKKK